MSQQTDNSRGTELAQRLATAARRARRCLGGGARSLPVVTGVTPSFTTVGRLENVLDQVQRILTESTKIFCYGNDVVMEVGEGEAAGLIHLTTGPRMERDAPHLLANLFVCQSPVDNGKNPVEHPPPSRLVATVLSRQPTIAALPRVLSYARRPVFDSDFVLRGPDWHPDVQILVHGIEVEPILPEQPDEDLSAIERLPTWLHGLLADFAFRSGADVANALGVMLTGVIGTSLIGPGKAIALLDGNQPDVGKTLFAQTVGIVLDGRDPKLIPFTTNDEELGKCLCATLTGEPQSVVIFDNAKVRTGLTINSTVIEANCTAPHISLRILGVTKNYTRPNDLLWFVTMNNTQASPDLVSRGVPVRFYFDGHPGERDFGNRDPITFAKQYRAELLGELVGMIDRWTQQGRPAGPRRHRLAPWASIVGGILLANGFPEFLANLDESAAEFNTELDDLAALAEAAIGSGTSGAFFTT